jgi:hypothetical protein
LFEKKEKYEKAFDDYLLASKLNAKFFSNFSAYLDRLLANPETADLLWNIPLPKLEPVPHFFVNTIYNFRCAKLESEPHKRLVRAVFLLWDHCRCKEDGLILNQFTNLWALEGMRKSRKLRLFPINYQNDPEEGKVFYMRLTEYFRDNPEMKNWVDTLAAYPSEKVAFIRSLTTHSNTLLMWNSSYSGPEGISVGISAKRINKGQGISRTIPGENQTNENDLPINKTGLYKVCYIGKDIQNNENHLFREIASSLAAFDEAFTDEFNTLLAGLFISIAHLIKDVSYEHEAEYRLLYIDVLRNNPYIQSSLSNGLFGGVFVNTEPILFEDDSAPVYFNPKIDDITIQKYRHAFRLEGLPKNGSVEKLLRSSEIKFR